MNFSHILNECIFIITLWPFYFCIFKYILLIMLLQLYHFFLPFILLCHEPPPTSISQPQFMPMCHTYKFFNFSISHTILNLPLSVLYLSFTLLIPCTFFPILSHPPADNHPCDLHFCDSVPVLVVCLVCFFLFFLFFLKVQLLIVLHLLSFSCSCFWSSFS